MKKLIIAAACCTLFAFTATYVSKPNTAEVTQVDGIYVFTDALPVSTYKVLGTLNAQTLAATYNSVRDKCVKKTKEQYPLANAIMLSFNGSGRGECTAIHLDE